MSVRDRVDALLTEPEGIAMFDWMKRSTAARDRVEDSLDDVRSYLGGRPGSVARWA